MSSSAGKTMAFGNKFGKYDHVECGLIVLLPKPNDWDPDRTAPVPLTSVNVVASVVHAVAQVELTQVYVNKEDQPIEAIYYFPVDSNGAVTHFHAELEGRTITGVVKPQEEAKEQYEKAVAQKQTAFLGESNKPDIFKVKIGYLKPGTEVKVVIGYVTEVKNEKESNAIRFFLPTTVAPRYIPPTETDVKSLDLKNMKFSESTPAPLSIRVNVSLQGGIKTIESPTHSVKTVEKAAIPEKPEWTRGIVELTGKTTDMDRDFVLLVTPEDVHVPRLYSEKFEGTTAVMTHLIPSFNLDEQKVELIFVLDRSGSMMGQSIDLAKKALVLFLHSAPVDCYFNIVGFGSSFEFLFPESVKYDDGSLKKAVAHASQLQANLGGTEIYAPLKAVYEKKLIPGYLRQIFVLTDGEVSNTDQVIGLVKAHAHSGRLFSLGIGDASSHHLVEGLSEAGGGTATFVTYQEKIETKVLHQLKNAIQPSLMDVEFAWTGVSEPMQSQPVEINKEKTLLGYGKPIAPASEQPKPTFSQVPNKVPPIYDGSQLLVFGLFSTEVPTAAKITAQSPDGQLSVEIKLDEKNDLGTTGMIHKLAAVKMIRELEMEVAALGYVSDNAGESKKTEETLKKEITELSVKHGVGSKYTSFVAVDSGDTTNNENWVMQTRYVASQIAHGWHGGMQPMLDLSKKSGLKFRTGGALRCYMLDTDEVACSMDRCEPTRKCAPVGKFGEAVDGSYSESRSGMTKMLKNFTSGIKRLTTRDSSTIDSSENPSSSEEKSLHALVATQSFDGSFPLTQSFADAIGAKLKQLKAECDKNGWDAAGFGTALALAYLEQKLKHLKESWELVAAKARKWLEKNAVSAEVINRANSFF